jgi:hypothetical protein
MEEHNDRVRGVPVIVGDPEITELGGRRTVGNPIIGAQHG